MEQPVRAAPVASGIGCKMRAAGTRQLLVQDRLPARTSSAPAQAVPGIKLLPHQSHKLRTAAFKRNTNSLCKRRTESSSC